MLRALHLPTETNTPLQRGDLDMATLEEQIPGPYYVPANTAVFSQPQFFQENRQRNGLVVDEYGEMLGLITLEDIIEELDRRVHHIDSVKSERPLLGCGGTGRRRALVARNQP